MSLVIFTVTIIGLLLVAISEAVRYFELNDDLEK